MRRIAFIIKILQFSGFKDSRLSKILIIIFREGVKLLNGGKFGNGRIVMTKTLNDNIDIGIFMTELLDAIRFPGELSLDAHGFCQTKKGEPIFIFGSLNSGIKLWNDKQSVLLRG